jgi:hypothetical protein
MKSARDTMNPPPAAAPDGMLAIIYVPSTGREGREFTVDMGRFTASVTSSWFNPTNGQSKLLAKRPLANQGTHRFQTPGVQWHEIE